MSSVLILTVNKALNPFSRKKQIQSRIITALILFIKHRLQQSPNRFNESPIAITLDLHFNPFKSLRKILSFNS